MNDRIPLKFRAIAAGLHAIATLPAVSVILILSQIFFSSFFTNIGISTIINGIPVRFIFILSPILSWILWLSTKSIHPFIDRSGKNAINYALNSFLALLFSALLSIFVFGLTCGIAVVGIGAQTGSGLTDLGMQASIVCAIATYCVAIAYPIGSTVAGINAWNGSYFTSRFIYPFER